MLFDYGQFSMMGGVIVFPDWPFIPTPLQPSQILESFMIQGTTAGAAISITGTVDD